MHLTGNIQIQTYQSDLPRTIMGSVNINLVDFPYSNNPKSILVSEYNGIAVHPSSETLNRIANCVEISPSGLNLLAVENGVIKTIKANSQILDTYDVEFRKQHPQAEEAWQNVLSAVEEYIMVKKLVG